MEEPAVSPEMTPPPKLRIDFANATLFAGILAALFLAPAVLLGSVLTDLRLSLEAAPWHHRYGFDSMLSYASPLFAAVALIFGALALVLHREHRRSKGSLVKILLGMALFPLLYACAVCYWYATQ